MPRCQAKSKTTKNRCKNCTIYSSNFCNIHQTPGPLPAKLSKSSKPKKRVRTDADNPGNQPKKLRPRATWLYAIKKCTEDQLTTQGRDKRVAKTCELFHTMDYYYESWIKHKKFTDAVSNKLLELFSDSPKPFSNALIYYDRFFPHSAQSPSANPFGVNHLKKFKPKVVRCTAPKWAQLAYLKEHKR